MHSASTYDCSPRLGHLVADDGEERVCAVYNRLGGTPTGYIYDANGDRVAKGTICSWSCNLSTNGFTLTSSYVLGLGGEQVSELTVAGGVSTWNHSNVFAAGRLLATYTSTGTYFSLNDWLGTKRAEIGTAPYGCANYSFSLAFGDGLNTSGNCPTDASNRHFTGKERDTQSGLDYFGARYYNSAMGRWMSPDWADKPEAVPYSDLMNPQSLNLYGYEGNNPLSKADKDGHCWPLCTALVGAGLGAVAEGLSELANGQKLNGDKIGAAAAGGALVGAITGSVGDAAEVGLVAKALVQVGASVAGGALETKLNGGTLLSKAGATGALKDAVAGAAGGKVEQAAGKLAATEGAKTIIPAVVNTATDAARRAVTPDPPKPAPPPPPPRLKQTN